MCSSCVPFIDMRALARVYAHTWQQEGEEIFVSYKHVGGYEETLEVL